MTEDATIASAFDAEQSRLNAALELFDSGLSPAQRRLREAEGDDCSPDFHEEPGLGDDSKYEQRDVEHERRQRAAASERGRAGVAGLNRSRDDDDDVDDAGGRRRLRPTIDRRSESSGGSGRSGRGSDGSRPSVRSNRASKVEALGGTSGTSLAGAFASPSVRESAMTIRGGGSNVGADREGRGDAEHEQEGGGGDGADDEEGDDGEEYDDELNALDCLRSAEAIRSRADQMVSRDHDYLAALGKHESRTIPSRRP
jgi:hypothetical protein